MAKYLLDAPDAEMDAWKQVARDDGVSFAEWLRRAVRSFAAQASGGRGAVAAGPAPKAPPPKPSDARSSVVPPGGDLAGPARPYPKGNR